MGTWVGRVASLSPSQTSAPSGAAQWLPHLDKLNTACIVLCIICMWPIKLMIVIKLNFVVLSLDHFNNAISVLIFSLHKFAQNKN